MLTYVGRRLLIAVPVLSGLLLMSFVLTRLLPGDPILAMMDPGEIASPEYVARRRADLGLDESTFVQFLAWINEVFQGNLGFSYRREVAVTHMIGERIGPTALLASAGLVVGLAVGVLIGVFAALRQNSWFDHISSVVSMTAISVPNFFLGLLAIYVFAIWLRVLPSGGMRTLSAGASTVGDSLRHLLLPAGVLAVNLVGPFVRFTRQGMLEVLRQDYMTTAVAKGVSRAGVVVGHGLRTSLIPLVTVVAMQIPQLLTGVLLIEVIFSWPGVGRLTFEAISARDYPVILGVVFMSGVLVMVFNLLADLLAAVLDPRIRL